MAKYIGPLVSPSFWHCILYPHTYLRPSTIFSHTGCSLYVSTWSSSIPCHCFHVLFSVSLSLFLIIFTLYLVPSQSKYFIHHLSSLSFTFTAKCHMCQQMDLQAIGPLQTSPNQMLSSSHFISHTLHTLCAKRWASHLPLAITYTGSHGTHEGHNVINTYLEVE